MECIIKALDLLCYLIYQNLLKTVVFVSYKRLVPYSVLCVSRLRAVAGLIE